MPTTSPTTNLTDDSEYFSAPAEDDPFNVKGLPEDQVDNTDDKVDKTDAEVDKKGEVEDDTTDADDKAPARLRGKKLEDIYEEFRGLEREYSRQGNELGESRALLRQTLEQIMELSQKPAVTETKPITEDDFHESPVDAVKKLIADAVAPIKTQLTAAEQEAARAAFAVKHPGYMDAVRSPEFQEWLKGSAYRSKLFRAAANFDLDAGDELFTAWSEAKSQAGDDHEKTAADRQAKLRRASTETGGAARSPKGTHKRVFKSTELMRLYINDREAYNSLMPEIQLAFKEGRVK